MIDRDNDYSANEAPEKYGDPLRGVFAPQQNGVTFRYAPSFQFSCEAIRRFADLRVGPAFHAIAAPLPNGNFAAQGRIISHKSK
jgi:hypothetical protein